MKRMKTVKRAVAVLLAFCMCIGGRLPVTAENSNEVESFEVEQELLGDSGTEDPDFPSGDSDLMFITLAENTRFRWNANDSAGVNSVIHLDDYSGKNCYFRFHALSDGYYGIKCVDKAASENISDDHPNGEETGRYVDIDGKSTKSGAKLHLYETDDKEVNDKNPHRWFSFYYVKTDEYGNDYYYIQNKKSGLWVGYEDLDDDGPTVGDKLIQTDEVNRKLWIITNGVVPKSGNEDEEMIAFKEGSTTDREGGAYIEIFLDGTLNTINRVYSANTQGCSLHLYEMGTSSKWLIKWDKEHSAYTISAVLDNEEVSKRVWDIEGQTGNHVHIWSDSGRENNRNTNQLWRFIRQDDGTYKIQNARTGQYVDGEPDNYFLPIKFLSTSDEGEKFQVYAFSGTDTEVNFNYSVDWMKDIPDDVLLSTVNIPGSHDTGTAAIVDDEIQPYSFSQCQKYYYGEQLNVGVRSFDVRCNAKSDTASLSDVNIIHGNGLTRCFDRDGSVLTLQSLLDDSVRFLKNHPTETIIMMVKPDAGSVEGLAHALNSFITNENTKDYVYDKSDIPSMGEARGKIVFIRRFDIDHLRYYSPGFGISLANWDDYNYKDYKSTIKIYDDGNTVVNVQDAFNVSGEDKREYIEGAMRQTVGTSGTESVRQDAWIFNYTSCAKGFPHQLTEDINPWLYEDCMNNGDGYIDHRRLGMVMFNYIDSPLSKLIYETNNDDTDYYVPKVTAPTLVEVTYGDCLADADLSGQTGTENGVWTFEDECYIPTEADIIVPKPTHTIVYEPNDQQHYKAVTAEVEISGILSKTVYATVDSKEITYGDEVPELTFSFDESQLVGDDTLDSLNINLEIESPAYTTSGNLKAGTYTIKATEGENMYHVEFTAGTLTVKPKTLGIEWSDTKNLTYTGNPVNVTATLTGVLSGDDCTAAVTDGNATGPSWDGNPGHTPVIYTAEADLTGADSGNYRLPENEDSVDYYIRRATPDPNDYAFPTKAVMTYGQTLSEATLIGASGAGEFIFVSVDEGGNRTNINDTIPAAGTYSYKMVFIPESLGEEHAVLSSTPIDVIVSKKPVTARAEAKIKTYGDATPALTYTFDETQLVGTDTTESLGLTLSAGNGDNQFCNAGDYWIKKSACTSANYDVTVVPAYLTVSKKEAEITWSGTSEYTYNGNAVDITASVSNAVVGGNPCEVKVVGGKRTDAGSYRAVAVSLSNGNYVFKSEEANRIFAYEIKKADPTVTFPTAVSITYGENLDEAVFTGESSSVPGEFELEDPGRLLTVADSGSRYHISFVPKDTKNYNTITSAEGLAVTVHPKTVTVYADRKTKIYGQKTPALTWHMDESQLVGEDGVEEFDFTLTAGEGENQNCDVGGYPISFTATTRQNSNYAIELKKGVLIVDPRMAEIQWNPHYNIVVGGSGPSAKVTNLVDGDDCTVVVECDGTDTPSWTTGSETLKDLKIFNAQVAGLAGADCYNYTLPEEDLTIQYLVRRGAPDDYQMPKEAVMTYGQKLSEAQLIKASGDGTFTFVDDSSLHRDISNTAPDSAGTYIYTVKFTPTDRNKTPVYADITVRVIQKSINVNAISKEKIYGNNTDLDFELDESQLVFEDTKESLGLTLKAVNESGEDGTLANSPVGDYEIDKKACINNNYHVIFKKGVLKINPRLAEIQWNPYYNIVVGDPGPSAKVTNLVNGDDCTVTVQSDGTGTASWTTGSETLEDLTIFNAKVVGLEGAASNNYKLPEEDLTIQYLVRRGAPDDYQMPEEAVMTYGQKLSEAQLIKASGYGTFTFVNTSGSQEENISDTAPGSVGTYTYTVKFTPTDRNKTPVYADITVRVIPKSINVNAISKEKIYGNITDLDFELDESQLVFNDTKESLGLTLKAVNESGENGTLVNSPVGDYEIDKEACRNNNYHVIFKKGVLKVNPRLAEIKWDPYYSIVVGDPEPSAKITNLLDGDDCTVIVQSDGTGTASWTTGSETLEDLTIFNAEVVRLEGAESNNYKLPEENLTIQYLVRRGAPDDYQMPKGAVMTYGQKLSDAQLIMASGDGTFTFVDDSSLHRDISNTTPDSAGTYTYTIKFTPTDTNNKPKYAQITVQVRKKNIKVTALSSEKIYGETTDLEFELDESQLAFDDTKEDLRLTLKAVSESGEDGNRVKSPVGSYEIGMKDCGNDNYSITVESAWLYITPKVVSVLWSDVSNLSYTGSPVRVTAQAQSVLLGDQCDVKVANGNKVEPGTYYAYAYGLSNSNYTLPEDYSQRIKEYTIQEANGNGGSGNTDNGGSANTDNGGSANTDNGGSANTDNGGSANTDNGGSANTDNGGSIKPDNGNSTDTNNGEVANTDKADSPRTFDPTNMTVVLLIMLFAVFSGVISIVMMHRKRRM